MKSKSKSKTTPIVNEPMNSNLFGTGGFSDKISNFMEMDPTQFVAPASPLQTQAFASAANLGQGQAAQTAALDKIATAAPAVATPSQAFTYDAPSIGGPATAGSQNIGPASQASATLAGTRSILDDGGIQKYMDPALDAYIRSTMAEYDDQMGRSRAAMEAAAGGSGAFGGSRYGIQSAQFDSDSDRKRALTQGDLMSQAYRDALGAAGMDAGFRQSTDINNANALSSMSQFNAGSKNSIQIAQADLNKQIALANAGWKNDFAIQQAQMKLKAASDAAAAQQSTSMFNAGNETQISQFNADQALRQAGLMSSIGTATDTGLRADTALTAGLGEQQRAIDEAIKNAIPTQMQIGGSLYGMISPAAYIGANNVTKNSGSIGGTLAGIAGAGLGGWAAGGFKPIKF